ncbi:MAG: hypothetical protein E6J01_03940 [Chloroflexi bacterium]|nr:MAG: hypothetical protein E6J01_03940 [Chloroflexota bacterium]
MAVSLRDLQQRGNGKGRQPRPQKAKTYQFRQWKTLNLTDARASIEDSELSWCENALPIGNGAIQILNGPGASIATIAQGIASLWGVPFSSGGVFVSINSDGSISKITTGGVVTVVAAAGTVTTAARLSMWQGSTALIIDPTKGYFSYDGTTFTTISASQKGDAIAVFEGRAWISSQRTITYTAPNTFNDFTAGNGAGSTIITDAAFPGNVVALASTLEALWIVGQGGIEQLANVTASGVAPNVITSFSITNIVSDLGSNAQNSVIPYFRALALFAPFGPWVLSLCLLFLVTYTGTQAQAGAGPIPIVIGFTKGKVFLASQGTTIKWITTLIVNGVAQAWGADTAGHIFQLFGASNATATPYKIQTRLFDFGLSTTMKACYKIGFEFQASAQVNPTVTVDSEFASQTTAISAVDTLTLINAIGATLQLQNAALANLTITAQGMVLARANVNMWGHFLGVTVSGNDPPYRIQAIQLEVVESRTWSFP